jgi:REP element-mobilizing transposase RayT
MPNHVHFIVDILETGHLWAGAPTGAKTITIAKIVNSLKTITSKQIGYSIWQRNYYEHIIRNEKELYRIIEYIEYNPINWKSDPNYIET